MRPNETMERTVGGLRYRVATATLLAHDVFWDGQSMERHGRNDFLYRTPSQRYFLVTLTQWQAEHDTLRPVSEDEAIQIYEHLSEHLALYHDAFPDVQIEDA